jgi:HAD superfamily hydrolase (TIGR01484 family)
MGFIQFRKYSFYAILKTMKGIIALDIDGTITADLLRIPQEVLFFLKELSEEWIICLVTGRSFHFAEPAIKNIDFPFHLAVLNGSLILKMPEREIVKRHYIELKDIDGIEKICENDPTDFVIYSGFENRDVCYFRPQCFSEEILKYLQARAVAFKEIWKPIKDFHTLNHDLNIDSFPSLKVIGSYEVVQRVAKLTMEQFDIAMPVIRDPRKEGYYVGLGTHIGINKGNAVIDLKESLRNRGVVIAAGDDFNDIPMLRVADICIVMETAPEEMHAMADIVAKPASENGIIEALRIAVARATVV